jgi:hypothetical protein
MTTPLLHKNWLDIVDLIAVDELSPISNAQLECALRGHLEQEPLPVIEW